MNISAMLRDDPPPAGHNSPPECIDFAREAMTGLSQFLADNPVIENEEQARKAKAEVDRVRATMGEAESERDKKVRPLNEQVSAINAEYKAVHNTDSKRPGSLDRLLAELLARMTVFAKAEETRRAKEAEAKRVAAELAEMEARLAEQREREANENAAAGELDIDLAGVVTDADEAFADFQRSERTAARAEREVPVRVGGGFSGRALSMRTSETLQLDDAGVAIKETGVTEKIETAILSAARDYRRLNGKLPAGVSSVKDRSF